MHYSARFTRQQMLDLLNGKIPPAQAQAPNGQPATDFYYETEPAPGAAECCFVIEFDEPSSSGDAGA